MVQTSGARQTAIAIGLLSGKNAINLVTSWIPLMSEVVNAFIQRKIKVTGFPFAFSVLLSWS